MTEHVHDRLDATFDEHSIVRQLHAVPPHEVYEVRVDGQRAVYKGDTGPTGSASTEGRVTRFVGEHTTVSVPDVLSVGDDYYVAAWHPDAPAPDGDQRADERWARAAGSALATLHEETAASLDGYGRLQFEDGMPHASHGEWQTAAIAFVQRRRPLLANHGHADIADAVLDCFREHPGLFGDAGDPVCCHGWWSPEHVAVEGGDVTCVVDFEHAIAAPAGFDYWRTVLSTFDGDTPQRAFRDGYDRVRPLPDDFDRKQSLYAVLHTVYFFESLYVQNQHGPDATATHANALRDHVFEALSGLD
ncbi:MULTISPECIES: phosphotransferase family protein [Halobacterium]|uniref:phosphotransferase family protein n=1 Tax=Halobacterium TaxID=2239 RepID=UPI00073E2E43|nr:MULTISPECIES: phosphotransferase [Halobacterium]MCG1004412.1 phosphotransferase [Halobacterium noricense]